MVLLNPAGLAALALIPVLVALYLLRLRRKQVIVSSLLPWRQVIEQSRRRSLFHKLRNPLSLLLQVLILALVTLALARPEFSATARTTSATVILLDTSLRMQAHENGSSRFDAARHAVEALVRRAHSGNQIALVSFDSAPRVLTPFSPDERTLLEGLASASVNDCAPNLALALQLARDLLASREGSRRIIMATGLVPPLPGADEKNGAIHIERLDLGGPFPNVAITSFSARPLLPNPAECEALVEASNFSQTPWDGSLNVHLDGALVEVRPLSLKPGEVHHEIISGIDLAAPRLNPRGWLTAHIDARDALEKDNTAYAVAPTPGQRRVLLVSNGNWFLQNLLAADPRTSFEMLSPANFRTDAVRGFDAVIFDGERPRNLDLTSLTSGNYLFLGVSPFRPPEKPPRRGAPPEPVPQPDISGLALTETREDHPLLRGLDLTALNILKARTLPPQPEGSPWQCDNVASAGAHPLLVAGRRTANDGVEQQRFVALAFGVSESDLPLRVAFPLFMNNTLQWLSREEPDFLSSIAPGETIVLDAGESLWTAPQTRVEAVPEEVPPQQIERVSFRPVFKGFYQRDVRGRQTWIAVSGANTASSDFSPPASTEVHAPSTAVPVITGAPRSWHQLLAIWPPWVALACGAVAALSLEWWLFHKRRTE